MRKTGLTTIAAILLAASVSFAGNKVVISGNQQTCPVMKEKINRNVHVDRNNERVYLCCDMCVDDFQASTDKFIQGMKKSGVKLDKIASSQTVCPVMGGSIDKNVYVDYSGKRIYLCCAACREKFDSNAEGYIKMMNEKRILLESAPDYSRYYRGASEGEPRS